ncbi:putative ADP-ribosylation factor 1 [Paratrimastix pyriformis]|uniref:ADP-ribosylation factor 1 n=1 Tax=Paratrimastix pyriformis TaxID=342808 RepID=A0ABQ8URT8_9EUKA|nr:putative ADP-ribosylation factor 1 [Paratrimastix pyriformis]QXF29086.1 Arl1 [Paratrimastix pyriformis]|eukprot:GAFH01004944.1.p1 GENE.GAFH01004944.1~~GAFH01004944.1.p1  ORF type:complete len:191 (+),score=32.27 GAFH01004944.1:41-574(+)
MGHLFSRLFSTISKKDIRVLIIGLDNAGKTTILYRMQLGQLTQTLPTVGLNVEELKFNGLKLTVWDLGGQATIRPYWKLYYQNCGAIVFVVDSSDTRRLGVSRQELFAMLQEEELQRLPVLIFANKMDLPGALSVAAITEQMHLTEIRDRPYHIQQSSAVDGRGLAEGFTWLTNQLK